MVPPCTVVTVVREVVVVGVVLLSPVVSSPPPTVVPEVPLAVVDTVCWVSESEVELEPASFDVEGSFLFFSHAVNKLSKT